MLLSVVVAVIVHKWLLLWSLMVMLSSVVLSGIKAR
jgi:hypothetical protein